MYNSKRFKNYTSLLLLQIRRQLLKVKLSLFQTLLHFKFIASMELRYKQVGPLYVSGKLPTYPSPDPTFCPKGKVRVNVGLWEGDSKVTQGRRVTLPAESNSARVCMGKTLTPLSKPPALAKLGLVTRALAHALIFSP